MKERIREFIRQKGLNAKNFADEIGVQASSVSHILTGRNQPSVDFLVKMLNRYPSMDLKYIISGDKTVKQGVDELSNSMHHNQKDREEKSVINQAFEERNTNVNSNRVVTSIILLMDDGTFQRFEPSIEP
ncbi:MAG: helix-turn-helix transcriptional regulator [Vicingaceae bacterium]